MALMATAKLFDYHPPAGEGNFYTLYTGLAAMSYFRAHMPNILALSAVFLLLMQRNEAPKRPRTHQDQHQGQRQTGCNRRRL